MQSVSAFSRGSGQLSAATRLGIHYTPGFDARLTQAIGACYSRLMSQARTYELTRGTRVALLPPADGASGIVIDVLGFQDVRVRWDSGFASSEALYSLLPLAPFTTLAALCEAIEQDRPTAIVTRGPRGGFKSLRMEGMKRGGVFVKYALTSSAFKYAFEHFFEPYLSDLNLSVETVTG